ncbi:Ku protein (plasmid) [Sporosarcina psychrophila]|uniref:non-homologous end joining protein Ku n=1 Tax=Sporosarcina psychrophila TaxID=1476 RepID=UPI0030D437B4
MHTVWKGVISFGLVTIPVKLHAATEDKGIKLRQIHDKCKRPIKQEKVCPICNEDVDSKSLVKGYEYATDRFVVVSDAELDGLKSDIEEKAVDILEFVKLKEIDPVYFDKTYYLAADANASKAYALLREALTKSKRIGIAKITIRSKERLAAVRVRDNNLVLETLHFPDEVRSTIDLPQINNVKLTAKEKEIALLLIEQLASEFEPTKYHDEYRESLEKLIKSKIPKNAEQPSNVINLMDAMEKSIASIKEQKKRA